MFYRFIHYLKAVLYSKWAITLIGLLALSFLIWFGGPLIAIAGSEPFSSPIVRLVIILCLTFFWAGINIYQAKKEKRSNEENVNSLLNISSEEEDKEGIDHEIDTLRARITKAISILKTSSLLKGKSLYELPWYILIGPPGTGKTTALYNSGLEFPLKDQLGDDPLAGVGGTRHCDWWFTNKAILIDTAGRYTTQNSNAKLDSKAWLGFLGLLKKYRTQKPINGAIITISLTSLMNDTPTERTLQARAIKQRLQELKNRLGMNFPVYVIFTKADLVAGFNEFFEGLSQEQREQVFGITLPEQSSEDEQGVVSQFNREFHRILENLTQQINEKVFNVADKEKRLLIYEFPKQLRMLQAAADDLLKIIFSPNSFEEPPMLRGIYLVSATQKGTPIDKVISEATHSLGMGEVSLHQHGGQSKGYFVKNLFEQVIFPEQDAGTLNRIHERNSLLIRRCVIGASCLLLVTSTVLWSLSYRWNMLYVDKTEEVLDEFDLITGSGLSKDTDIVSLVKALDYLKQSPNSISKSLDGEVVVAKNLGLYQGDKIGEPLNVAYYRVLKEHFSPYITSALIHDMNQKQSYLEYLYETLKTYLMLFDSSRFNKEQVLSWYVQYYGRNYPGEINADLRTSLLVHTDAMLESGVRTADYDDDSVRVAREALSELPLSERAYQRLKLDYKSSHIPDFRITNVIGSDSHNIFYRESGKKLSEGIPGLYTYNGFHSIFQLENQRIVKRLMEDSWIYGDEEIELSKITNDEIMKEVESKYYQEYIFVWEKLISDLRLKEFDSASEGIDIVSVLSGSERPIQNMIYAIQKQLKLSTLPAGDEVTKAAKIATHAADVALENKKSRIERYLPVSESNARGDLPGEVVEDYFSEILDATESDLKQINYSLSTLESELLNIANVRSGKVNQLPLIGTSNNTEINSAFRKLRDTLPEPFSYWLVEAHNKTTQLSKEGTQSQLNDIWQDQVYREYKKAIRGKYPLSPNARHEVKLKDFSKFFGYGGVIDSFFSQYVEQYVDTSRNRWRFVNNVGISNRSLRQFQRAREIRNKFFEPGTQNLNVEFGMETVYLDLHISNFRFELGDTSMTYRHGPTRVNSFKWPTNGRSDGVRLIFTPPQSGFSITKEYPGEWGLFRMFTQAKNQRAQTVTDKVINVDFKGNKVAMKLVPSSVSHPFWLKALESFSCPARL
ncbi:type VI secretion system membrane subunit TssM [Photobacterium atrarenae]|uniref:Type VI secretion system membrane subunit TssM n=1 Tax=Photobacterium atrarenae TaxID=865757 RepID=A0ABY5GCR4_9GAMM|nr:type VI secretion system membrane subunit TssM [Photobacterium atrarenae]UTV26499.1 type VI secretion system membrane subunit TssM [Photobacterium atrarenae]